jgi:hypothetical protein
MRKLSYVLAALATIAVAGPTVASAQGFSVRIGGDRDYYRDRDYYGPRVGFYGHDRGWHRGWSHRGLTENGPLTGAIFKFVEMARYRQKTPLMEAGAIRRSPEN